MIGFNLIFQGRDDVILSLDIFKIIRSEFTI